jgi:uncharacterized protein
MKMPVTFCLACCCAFSICAQTNPPGFKVIGFYPAKTETAHLSFIREANRWFLQMAADHGFSYDSTDDWDNLNSEFLAKYQVVVFLDMRPDRPAQRSAFQRYMESGGGGWMGFHFAGFALTPSEFPQNWDWYHNEFLGAGSYVGNTWRPTSAILKVEDRQHPAMKGLPETFKASPNEWYKWTSDLRTNSDIQILASIDPSSFPLGTGPKQHEIWHSGYYPVVWANRKYRMVYFNMGHNDLDFEKTTNNELSFAFGNEPQDRLILNALEWLGTGNKTPTVAQAPASAIHGAPRLTQGHSCTLWDNKDIAAYKSALGTHPDLKAAFDKLRAWGDERITQPLNVPTHKLEADGTWAYPAFKRGYQDASGKWTWEWNFNTALQQRAADVSNLGMLYALAGDEKYADFARQILLALADAYGHGKGSPVPDAHGYDHFEAYGFDGGDTGMFLAKGCHGYDLIYNLPALSVADRAHIERDLLRPLAEHLKRSTFMYTSHGRWGMVCLYGLFVAGVTINDQGLVDLALYGQGGTKDKVTGGFMDCFKPACLRDGVVWGADTKIGEQMAAVCVLTTVAEVMWHRGVDLYGYQDSAMKKSYDAAVELAGKGGVSKLLALPGIDAYQYAYRRYQEPRYLTVVGKLTPGFTLAIGEHLPTMPAAEASLK